MARTAYPTPQGDGMQPVADVVTDLRRQARAAQRPNGTRLAGLVDQVQAALVNIAATVISTTNTYLASASVTLAALTVSAATTVGGLFTANTGISSTGAYNNNITGTRLGAWWASTGAAGVATSSSRFKTNIVDAELNAEAILSVAVKHYQFVAEIAKRDDPSATGYVGPEYQVHTEVGAIAEDLHDAGLWEFVDYEREIVSVTRKHAGGGADEIMVERLKLDADGQPIPYAIHYEMFSVAVLAATQFVWAEHQKVRSDTDRILAHLGLDSTA